MSLLQMVQLITSSFAFCAVLLLLMLLPLLFLLITRNKEAHLPPSPPKLPIIGNLHQLGSLPHRSLFSLSRKHGPIMHLKLGSVPALVVSSADAAREVMKTHELAFANRPSLKVARQLLYQSMDLGFAQYGERWRQMRKLCVTHLLSTNKVRSYRPVREEEVAFMVEKITRSSSSEVINMSEILSTFANDMVSRLSSGKSSRDAGRNSILLELSQETSRLLGSFRVGDYFPLIGWLDAIFGLDARVLKAVRKWNELLDEVIDDHARRSKDIINGDKNGDFVDVMLKLQKDTSMDFTLTNNDIKAIVVDMLAAGTETTFTILEWGMAELVRNSKVMKKLQEEVISKANGKSMINEDDLIEMDYLKAVIKETLRLHPSNPLLVPRESMEPTNIMGYEIPKGTRALVNVWAMGRDPNLWEAPYEFRPERFMNSLVDFKGPDFQFIPFGAGRRGCPGTNFAIFSIELALANVVYLFDWKLPKGTREEDLDMTEAPGLATRRKEMLHLTATPRIITK